MTGTRERSVKWSIDYAVREPIESLLCHLSKEAHDSHLNLTLAVKAIEEPVVIKITHHKVCGREILAAYRNGRLGWSEALKLLSEWKDTTKPKGKRL